MPDYTLAQVDDAILKFDRDAGNVDDLVMLLLTRADLAGIPLSIEQVARLLVVSDDEAMDIFARLSERGFIESADDE